MVKKIFFVFFVFQVMIYGKIIKVFDSFSNPDNLVITNNRLIISEDAKIFIYSLKDIKLLKSFGKEGEGPKEFIINKARGWDMVQLVLRKNQIIINSSGLKFSYFNINGEYIKEERIPGGRGGIIEPFINKYVATKYKPGKDNILYHSIVFLNSEFKEIYEIYKHKHGLQIRREEMFNPLTVDHPFFKIADNKIFVINGARDKLIVFDRDGKKLFTIRNDSQLVRFTKAHKEGKIRSYNFNKFWKRFYELRKKYFKFPNYFPALRDFKLDKRTKKIYISTHKVIKEERIYLVYDFFGKYIDQKRLPSGYGLDQFYGNNLYQLIENEDTESWELHKIKL